MRQKIWLLIGLIIVIGAIFLLRNPLDIFANSAISGQIDLNGNAPSGSTISILSRKVGASQFDAVVMGITSSNGATWEWKGAKAGSYYQLQASIESSGVQIAQSEIITVASPASEEILTINLPSTPTRDSASISGTADINGPIPSDSSLTILYRKQGDSSFSTAVGGVSISDGAEWSWSNAISGVKYELKGYIVVNNTNFAESKKVITATAPATDEVLSFNLPQSVSPALPSTVTTPTASVTSAAPNSPTVTPTASASQQGISGKINLNGNVPSGATITISTRVSGQTGFNNVIGGLTAQNGTQWNWTAAASGVSYDVQANLINGNNTIATSVTLTITAPAGNEVLTLNYGSGNLPVPPLSPGVYCLNQGGSNNQWNANISYHSVNGAAVYWVQIYDTNNNSIYSSQIPPNNQQLPTTYNFNTNNLFNTGATYYVQYAYSTCATCTNTYSYSPFTPATQFSCAVPSATPQPTYTPYPTQPVPPTYTPYPTNLPSPTAAATATLVPPTITVAPTSTPAPSATPAPKISSCNQSCGGNGYSCESGLECLSSELIGGSLCRNPQCTDQTDCKCN